MLKYFKRLLGSNYQPLNRITIDRNQLIQNLDYLKNYKAGIAVSPVLKSNAYGHGLLHISGIVDQQKPPFICVDSLPEANVLNKAGIKSPILIMGSIAGESLKKKLPYQLTIINKEFLHNILKHQKTAAVHLFVDTGMNREGISIAELPEILELIKNSKLKLAGLMSHLAFASVENHPLNKTQINNFAKAKEIVLQSGMNPEWIHLGGSDCLPWVDGSLVNLVRTGRVLYGVDAVKFASIKPVLQLESTIVQLKQIKKGESIGYSATYSAQKDSVICLLPIGYNDGVDRRLSNNGVVKIKGHYCPIVGLISMNMTVVDVSKVHNPLIGDKAVIYSVNADEKNSIVNSALKANTNPSQILVGLHPSIRREIV